MKVLGQRIIERRVLGGRRHRVLVLSNVLDLNKYILLFFLGWVVVLAQVATTMAQQANIQNNFHLTDKLISSKDIMKGFEEGESEVKVIVNLAEPLQVLTTVDWKSASSLSRLQDEILTRQRDVLSGLPSVEFSLRRRFENQAGFSGEVTPEGLDRLLNDPRVKSIEPVYALDLHLAQGIPLINASVYRSTYNGQGVAVAICDTGIDTTHPRLSGKVIGGYDFGNDDSNPTPDSQSCEDYFDAVDHAHGTCCGGIAAGALGTSGDYIGGVAHNAKLYSLKVIDSDCIMYNDYVIAAWNWCVSHKYDNPDYPILVINNSIGGGRFFGPCDGYHTAFATAANNAVAAGITVLASSGNSGYCDSIESPACVDSVISVGAVYDAALGTYCICVDEESCASPSPAGYCPSCDVHSFSTLQDAYADVVTAYSNSAYFLDILAPAHNTYTTDIRGSGGYTAGDYITNFGGTSAACPYAAGAVACLQSAAKICKGRYLSPSEVKSVLTSTGNNRTDKKVSITKPRINLGNAIDDPLVQGDCISVISPSAGSSWECDKTYTIMWNPIPNTDLVDIWLTKGGDSWLIVDDTADSGSYNWALPTCLENGCDYQIEIRSSSDPSCNGTSDNFCITCCVVVVASPTGNSVWECEDCYNVTWSSKCNPSNYVEINIYRGGLLVQNITYPDSGSYQWCLPEGIIASCDYQIEVKSSSGASCSGISDNFCVICPCVITVTSPADGGWWDLGDELPIRWDFEHYSGEFKIELYKGGLLERIIDPCTSENESYVWPIPTEGGLTGGDDYQIKVTAIWNTLCFDESNEFGIATPPEAEDSSVSTEADTSVRITLQAVDEVEGYPEALTYTIMSLPLHGELSDPYAGPITDPCVPLADSGNQVDYSPHSGYLGQDSFTFKANDGGVWPGGGDSDVATVWIKVGVFYVAGLDDDAGWSVSGSWEWGTPSGSGGSSYGNPDPNSGYTGSNVYGVNLNGDYSTGIGGPYYLTTEAIGCSEHTNVHLGFYRWLNCDYEPYVYETVEASNDGSTWTVVWENGGPPDINDGSWQLCQYDISSVADKQPSVYIRWGHHVARASALAYSGWNIDDVEVVGKRRRILFGDFEGDDDVDFEDFDILAGQWLQAPGSPSADIAPETPDGVVDTLDLAVFAEEWLAGL